MNKNRKLYAPWVIGYIGVYDMFEIPWNLMNLIESFIIPMCIKRQSKFHALGIMEKVLELKEGFHGALISIVMLVTALTSGKNSFSTVTIKIGRSSIPVNQQESDNEAILLILMFNVLTNLRFTLQNLTSTTLDKNGVPFHYFTTRKSLNFGSETRERTGNIITIFSERFFKL